ncbi:MAG: putative molybdenum carrier protein [Planctomycetota bacterium]|nr:putative molybdenum carrier protein [Planctomycetota bacterium]
MNITTIISGGQTGADRAALDVALALGLKCRGWCPRNRVAEDGPIDMHYPLRETASDDPADRTRCNVRDADGTLILASGELQGGTALTRDIADELGKPLLIGDPAGAPTPDLCARIHGWIAEHGIAVLNVAGPRESESPGAYEQAGALLRALLARPEEGEEA